MTTAARRWPPVPMPQHSALAPHTAHRQNAIPTSDSVSHAPCPHALIPGPHTAATPLRREDHLNAGLPHRDRLDSRPCRASTQARQAHPYPKSFRLIMKVLQMRDALTQHTVAHRDPIQIRMQPRNRLPVDLRNARSRAIAAS
ncbi:hypothetical protein [Xylella fastidiosa]|uniref:hypothetical protein n=1 Tax=Xylella fastidiosa TaxID=2371 RepID=UPI0034DF3EBD